MHISERYAPGVETRGTVVRLLDKGVVVDLGEDIEGFVPISHLGIENVQDPADHFKEGQALDLRVLESDAANRRIVLTVTAIPDYEGGATPEGTELQVETEVRPTEEQIEAQAAAPESVAVDDAVPPDVGTEPAPAGEVAEAEAGEEEVEASAAEAPAAQASDGGEEAAQEEEVKAEEAEEAKEEDAE